MAGPLTGIGAGITPQPINNVSNGQNANSNVNNAREDSSAPAPGAAQEVSAAPAESANVETQNADVTARQDEQRFAAVESEEDIDTNAPPGSLVDITV